MYPGLFVWWNPVLHFPLSGAVNQEWVQQVSNQLRKARSAMSDIEKHLPASEKNQDQKLKEHLHELRTHLDLLDHTIKQW